jgi:peptide/nickel transport system substrate-binding protein
MIRTLSALAMLFPLLAGMPARAETQMLFLAEDVPVSLDTDGPAVVVNTSQTGRINLQESWLGYAIKGTNEDGIKIPDFTKFEGRLVESWSFDAPSLTWTLNLRHGVIGCSGNEFTADDMIYTLARAKSVSGQTAGGWFVGVVGGIKGFDASVFKATDKSLGDSVTKVDDYTVKIKQAAPDTFFLLSLTLHPLYVYDSKVMLAHATTTDPWSHDYTNTTDAPSFGPYCLERWVKGDEFSVRANPHYYRGKPAIDRIVMKKVPQSSNRVVTLRAGQAQLVQGLTPREYAGLRGARGVTVAGVFGNETLFIAPNYDSPLFDNLLVRQAMAYAIDYDQVLQTGYQGGARKWNSMVPTSFPGEVDWTTKYTYDPEKAKALLAQAGFPNGEGLEKYATDLRLTYASEREAVLGPIATVIQTSMRSAGIPLVLDPMPQGQIASRRSVKRDLPLVLSDIDKAVAIDTTYQMQLFFGSREVGGINNTMNLKAPDVDKLILAARAASDPKEKTEDEAKMQAILEHDMPWIPIAETKTQWAFSSKLHGLTWYPDNSLRWADLSLGD